MENLSATPLRAPTRGGRSVTILVVADVLNMYEDVKLSRIIVNDFVARDEYGYNKYDQNLETNDGRPTPWDLYQELLDACQYARKDIEEGGTVGVLVYDTLMNATRAARKGILESTTASGILKGDNDHDSEKERHDRATTEAGGITAQRDCESFPEGMFPRSGQRLMVPDRERGLRGYTGPND